MTTINQNLRQKIKKVKVTKLRRQALGNCPQRAGKCEKVFVKAPKKPSSGKRAVTYVRIRVAKIRKGQKRVDINPKYFLRKGKYVLCKIPGEMSNLPSKLTRFASVLVGGGRTLGIPGTKFKLIFTHKSKTSSLQPPINRVTSRSKFGLKDLKRIKEVRIKRKKNTKLLNLQSASL